MARSELVIELVKAALTQDSSRVKMLAESIVSEERQKEHHFVADQLASVISQSDSKMGGTKNNPQSSLSNDSAGSVVWRKTAEAKLSDIVLPESQKQEIIELIREQAHAQELIEYGVEPRSRVLLKGAPGNGKTMLAEVIASELGLPFLVVHYEDVVSSFLGETAGRLEKVFSEAAEAPCVLFLTNLM
jgi:ATPase, AAA family